MKLEEVIDAVREKAEREQRLMDEMTLAHYHYCVAVGQLEDAKNKRADKMLEMREAGFTANEIAALAKISEKRVYEITRDRQRQLASS